jgi:putative acetyltransferase
MNTDFIVRAARQSDVSEIKDLFQNTVLTINKQNCSEEEVED